MLDTNALSAWADDDTALLRILPRDRLWHIPVVVLGEFLFGIRQSRERAKLEQWIGVVKGVRPYLFPNHTHRELVARCTIPFQQSYGLTRLTLRMNRYANRPTVLHPWHRVPGRQ